LHHHQGNGGIANGLGGYREQRCRTDQGEQGPSESHGCEGSAAQEGALEVRPRKPMCGIIFALPFSMGTRRMKPIQMVDLVGQYQKIKPEVDAALLQVVHRSAAFINGPEVKEFEKELAAYLGVKHVVGCATAPTRCRWP
jgi:hypothetical protein